MNELAYYIYMLYIIYEYVLNEIKQHTEIIKKWQRHKVENFIAVLSNDHSISRALLDQDTSICLPNYVARVAL